VVLGPANFLVSTDLEGATIFETTDAGVTWTTSLEAGSGGFQDLDLLADGTVIAASSDGDIFRSTDGGTTWMNGITAASPNRNVLGAVNIGPTGRGAAGTSATPNIQWYVTTDHGANWTLDPAGPNIPFTRQIEYWDADHAIAAGATGVIWRTSDGGATWSAVSLPGSPPNGAAWHVSLPSSGVAFAAVTGQSQSVVFRTTDFGATWQLKSAGIPIAGGLTSVFALPSGTAYAAGYNGSSGSRLFRSTDNGESWTAVTSTGISGWTWDMHWHDDLVGIASVYLSPGGIYRTTDGGATWQNVWVTPARELSFSDPLHGFATNGSAIGLGSLAVTEDGGATWQSLVLPATKGGTAVSATATGCLVGGGNGEILEVTRLDAQAVDDPAGDGPGAGSTASTRPTNRLQVRPAAGSGFDITFELAEAGSADLTVVDVLGRRVARLARGSYDAHVAQNTTWDGRRDDGTRTTAGVYFARLSDHRSVRAAKLVVTGN
jgi:photosystem II stability/assembly factor-like uncharacterized protein